MNDNNILQSKDVLITLFTNETYKCVSEIINVSLQIYRIKEFCYTGDSIFLKSFITKLPYLNY